MQYSFAALALAAFAAAAPQQVTPVATPSSSAPAGCATSYSGNFNIQIVNVTDVPSSSIQKRQAQVLNVTLNNGILKDEQGRTGYIASNSQFQFDSPPQGNALLTSGWSICPYAETQRLTIGADDVWYSCLSGGFYNLYDKNTAAQCNKVYIDVIKQGVQGAVSVQPDGQPTGVPQAVTQISDGQPQANSAVVPVTQISDGQIQASSAVSPIAATTTAPVQQISDGQIQATTAVSPVAPVQQISDGQVQATSAVVPGAAQPSGMMPSNSTMPYMPVQTGNGASGLVATSGLGLIAAIFGVAML
jgi:hypothetical protein